MTNASLRERFRLYEGHQDAVAKLIQSTIQERLIKPVDPASRSRKYAKYVPFWA